MNFDPLSAAFELGKTAIEKIWPDPTKRAEEVRKLEELRQSGDIEMMNAQIKLLLGQIEINKLDAKSGNFSVKTYSDSTCSDSSEIDSQMYTIKKDCGSTRPNVSFFSLFC